MMLGADLVMNVSDLFNIFMAVPNLSAVLLMSGEISQCVKVYLKSNGKGRGKNKEKSKEKNKADTVYRRTEVIHRPDCL